MRMGRRYEVGDEERMVWGDGGQIMGDGVSKRVR